MSEHLEQAAAHDLRPPSTTDYLRFHALHRPHAIALVNNGVHLSYSEFYRDVLKFTQALRTFGLARGSAVGIECGNIYLHWVLLLACENLGLASASFLAGEAPDSALLACLDLVLCEHDQPSGAKRAHNLALAWLDQVQAQPVVSDGPRKAVMALGEIQRIKRSSGTTGFPKLMAVSRLAKEDTLQCYVMQSQLGKDSRLLLTSHFTVDSTYMRATVCLRFGGTCIFDSRMSLTQAILAYQPTHLRLFQYQAKLVLDELPQGFSKPPRLTVFMGAGPLGDEMRQAILARLAADLIYTYNNNEVGVVATIDSSGLATLRPGAEIAIVDENGVPAARGQTGQITIRTNARIDRYVGDPSGAADPFKDGWFYSGDAGFMVGPRQFKIVGRVDEVLNIGGMKMAPLVVEEEIAGGTPVAIADVGVTSLRGADGVEEICIAVVPNAGADVAKLEDWLRAKYWLGTLHFAVVDRIPRTETGKVQRHLLKAMFEKRR